MLLLSLLVMQLRMGMLAKFKYRVMPLMASARQILRVAISSVSQVVLMGPDVMRTAPFVSLSFRPVAVAKRMVQMQRFVSQPVKPIPNVLVVPTVVLTAFV